MQLACVDECEPSFCFWSAIEKMDIFELTGTLLLLSLFVISVAVIVERWLAYSRATRQTRAYETRALTALYYNQPEEAINAAGAFIQSPVAAVVGATIELATEAAIKPSWPAFHRAVIAQTRAITGYLWALSAIGWCSPPLGLLVALESTQHYEHNQFGLVAGLAIALPAISMHKYLTSRAELLILETDRMSLSIVEQISEQLGAPRRSAINDSPLQGTSTIQLSAETRAFTVTQRV